MPSLFDVGDVVGSVVDSVGDAADSLFTSDEERKKAERLMRKVEAKMHARLVDLKTDIAKQRGKALTAEIQGESWLQRNWRPITMLVLVGIIGAHWFGMAGGNLEGEIVASMYSLVKVGVAGYVAADAGERIAEKGRQAYTSKNSNL